MSTPLTLVVMAAGHGRRYGGPKQVDGVGPGGETLLEFGLFDAWRAGFDRVVFVARRDLARDMTSLSARLAGRLASTTVFQELDDLPAWFTRPTARTKPWGTAHAALAARNAVETPFAVVNADDFYGASAYRAAATFLRYSAAPAVHAVVAWPLADTLSDHGPVARAICRSDDGWLSGLEETHGLVKDGDGVRVIGETGVPALTGRERASMNCWGFHPSVLEPLADRFDRFLARAGHDPDAEAPLPDLVAELIHDGVARVRVLEAAGAWFGVTHRADRPRVVERLAELTRRGEYPHPLWE